MAVCENPLAKKAADTCFARGYPAMQCLGKIGQVFEKKQISPAESRFYLHNDARGFNAAAAKFQKMTILYAQNVVLRVGRGGFCAICANAGLIWGVLSMVSGGLQKTEFVSGIWGGSLWAGASLQNRRLPYQNGDFL